jgi:hypothetical protein
MADKFKVIWIRVFYKIIYGVLFEMQQFLRLELLKCEEKRFYIEKAKNCKQ